MPSLKKSIAGVAALAAATLMMSGCATIQRFLNEVPLDVPQPTLPATTEPLEKTYSGGERPAGLSDEEWAKKSQRRIVAAGALGKVIVYSVDADAATSALTVRIKGDPEDPQALADVEQYVVPTALKWAPTVTIVIDPSLCGVLGEVKDDTPLCDAITGG